MYQDNFSNKKSDPEVTKFPQTTVTQKHTENLRNNSTTTIFKGIQALEEDFIALNLEDEIQHICQKKVKCPCGCYLSENMFGPFRTRDMNTMALVVMSPDVLNYHGRSHQPDTIAMYWKKDCRTFLWKGKSKSGNTGEASMEQRTAKTACE